MNLKNFSKKLESQENTKDLIDEYMPNFRNLRNTDACNGCQYNKNDKCEINNKLDCFWNEAERYIVLGKMLSKMYMTKIEGKYVFTFDHLSKEEKEKLHSEFCNGI